MQTKTPSTHKTWTREMRLRHPAADVFPLLCPVREYDWIPTWLCELAHSESGVAEKGCVFTTNFPDKGPCVWVCSLYEPPAAVDYTTVFDAGWMRRLELRLRDTETGCTLTWTESHTGYNDGGRKYLTERDDKPMHEMIDYLEKLLTHYLDTGAMLQELPKDPIWRK